jgi:DNA-binding beta-propeller fold protein YncE
MNVYDRRRVTVATVFTVVVMLLLGAVDNDSSGGAASSLTVDTLEGSDTAPPTNAYDPDAPVFVADDGNPDLLTPAQVLVPPPPSGNVVVGRASHGRYSSLLERPCTTGVAPDQTLLTITNMNNGQSTTCVNTYGKTLPAGIDIVVDSDQFGEIANLTDAPIPVRITW